MCFTIWPYFIDFDKQNSLIWAIRIDTAEGTDYAVLVYIANAAGGFDGTLSAAVPLTIQLGVSASEARVTSGVTTPSIFVAIYRYGGFLK